MGGWKNKIRIQQQN